MRKPRRGKKLKPEKKRRKKQKQEDNLWDFELTFSDITLAETDGEYNAVKKLMTSEKVGDHEWTLRSQITIRSSFGEGHLLVNFNHDGSLYILEYAGGSVELYNPDIRCLCQWCQEAGWKIPEPSEELIKRDILFWKRMWQTLLIDSTFLDKRFGKRKNILVSGNEAEPENEIDELDEI